MSTNFDVSIILPVHNADRWLDECLQSICDQECHKLKVEVSAFFDSCCDESERVFNKWGPSLEHLGFKVTVSKENNGFPKGVGYAKNKAISQSSGEYLCFMDADDVMMPKRIYAQYQLAARHKNAIVGSKFRRNPEDSTVRFTKWANNLTDFELNSQIYTSNGPTVIMPTWFCHRDVAKKVGGFDEGGKGIPEDLIFFYEHIRLGRKIVRVNEELLIYRYHHEAATFSIHEETIWRLRVKEIEERVIWKWSHFTIWNGGKQGRKLFRSLRKENQRKVVCFCDVDKNKIGSFYTYEETAEKPKPKIPIIHFEEAKPPIIICMKKDLTGGAFEENLASLHLMEGKDYHHFN